MFPSTQVSDIVNPASWINQASCNHDPSARRKTSKYFGSKTEKDSDVEMADAAAGQGTDKGAAKRKLQKGSNEVKDDSKPLSANKMTKDDEDDDDDFVATSKKKTPVKPPPSKKPKVESNVEAPERTTGTDDGEEEDKMDEDAKTPSKGAGRGRGRGRGGRGGAAAPGGRGRGGGGRGFMNFGERKDPPHKGEKVSLIPFIIVFWKLKNSILICLFYLMQFVGGPRGCP